MGPAMRVRKARQTTRKGTFMKIKTNVRAGKGGSSGNGKNSKSINNTVVQVAKYISRCTGV